MNASGDKPRLKYLKRHYSRISIYQESDITRLAESGEDLQAETSRGKARANEDFGVRLKYCSLSPTKSLPLASHEPAVPKRTT